VLGGVSTFKNTCSLRGFIFSLLLLFGCCGLIVAAQALNTGAAGENNILEVGGVPSEKYVYDEDVGCVSSISVWVGGYLNVYQGVLTRWDYGFGPAGWKWKEVYPTDINGNPKYNVPYAYAQGKGYVLESSEYYEDVVYAKIP